MVIIIILIVLSLIFITSIEISRKVIGKDTKFANWWKKHICAEED